MPINKVVASFAEAVADIYDGASIMIGGFGGPGGAPQNLIVALREHGAKDLVLIGNTAGIASAIGFGAVPGEKAIDVGILVESGQVRKVVASFPVSPSPSRPTSFERAHREGRVELEIVPQGTLAERIRAAGAGIPAFYCPTGVGTDLEMGKETRVFDGRSHVLEWALSADFALLKGHKADTLGNVVYRGSSQNFNAIMATAAAVTVVEVDQIVGQGQLEPASVHTPALYVDRVAGPAS